MVFCKVNAEIALPEHTHGELWCTVVKDELTLLIDGAKKTYETDDRYHIPAGTSIQRSSRLAAGLWFFFGADDYSHGAHSALTEDDGRLEKEFISNQISPHEILLRQMVVLTGSQNTILPSEG